MAEVSFARAFLANLDTKPYKITADHVEDPRSYPARTPYTLPRHAKPMSRRTKPAPGAERSVAVTVKSLRNPPLQVDLAAQPLSMSVLEVKDAVAARTGVPADKIKVLHRKKPVPDSRSLADLLGGEEAAGSATTIEFSVMIMGGAAALGATSSPGTSPGPGGPGLAGKALLETDEFWGDLRGFLQQRLRDEAAADEVLAQFQGAWKGRS